MQFIGFRGEEELNKKLEELYKEFPCYSAQRTDPAEPGHSPAPVANNAHHLTYGTCSRETLKEYYELIAQDNAIHAACMKFDTPGVKECFNGVQ